MRRTWTRARGLARALLTVAFALTVGIALSGSATASTDSSPSHRVSAYSVPDSARCQSPHASVAASVGAVAWSWKVQRDAPSGCDVSTYTYGGAAHSVQVPTGEAALGAPLDVSDGCQWAVATAAGPFSVGVRLSVAADSAADVLATPQVASPKLQNIVDNLYKGTTNPGRVGNGTTMDAIANELETGLPTGGKFHSIKGQDSLNGLVKWLDQNPSAPYSDRLVAQSLADELSALLGGAS